MSGGRDRPPKLVAHVGTSHPAPAPTTAELLVRSKVAGPSPSGPGPNELRRKVERLALPDRRAHGEITPIAGLDLPRAWDAVTAAYGATRDAAVIDPACTVAGVQAAVARIGQVGATGARVAIATATPASLLTVHLAFARLVRDRGGELVDLPDVGPIRADGRAGRRLRWLDGVTVVSDGGGLCDTHDAEVGREWMFAIPRPALVIADGLFAEVAWEAGIEVVALAGLDRPALAIAGARLGRCTLVPLHTDREAREYRLLERVIAAEV